MNNKPLVSICIPTYNAEKELWRALESCINQTYQNIEIIICNDTSKDKTEKIALTYAAKDKRIKYFKNEKNLGVIKNFSKAFSLASGNFIQLLNHDDWLSKNYIEEGIKQFKNNPQTTAVISKSIIIEEKPNSDDFGLIAINSFKNKNYSTDYYLRNSYKSIFGALFMLSLMRKNDLTEAFAHLIEIIANSADDHISKETKKYLNIGYGIDLIVPIKVLTKYGFMTFTNESAYMKIERPDSLGKTAKFNFKKASGILGYNNYMKVSYEYAFRQYWPQYLFGMKIFMGAENIAHLAFGFIKNRLKTDYWEEADKLMPLFFKTYSRFEKILSIFLFIPISIIRIVKSIKRKFIPLKKSAACQEINFFDKNCKFKI